MNDKLYGKMEIFDPKLRKAIKRGWVKGWSTGGKAMTPVCVYPFWYKAWLAIRRWFRRLWWKITRRSVLDGVHFDTSAGIVVFKDPPKRGSIIRVTYKCGDEESK